MNESLLPSGAAEELFGNSSSLGNDTVGVSAKKESALKYYFLLIVSGVKLLPTFTGMGLSMGLVRQRCLY